MMLRAVFDSLIESGGAASFFIVALILISGNMRINI
jgi:hypothetical protein